jgi:hypothetical protein
MASKKENIMDILQRELPQDKIQYFEYVFVCFSDVFQGDLQQDQRVFQQSNQQNLLATHSPRITHIQRGSGGKRRK